jgi:hypothetical protein
MRTFYRSEATPATVDQLHLADMGFYSKNTIKCAHCSTEFIWYDHRNVTKHSETCSHKADLPPQYNDNVWYRQVSYRDVPSLGNAKQLAELGFYWTSLVKCHRCGLEINWHDVQDIHKVHKLHETMDCKFSS